MKKNEKALKIKIEHEGKEYVMIEKVPDQIITVTTSEAEGRKLDSLEKKRWRQHNPEPEFTIALHEKLEEKTKSKTLTQCGRIFACVIHTNFKQKEKGLIIVDGKAAKVEQFGKIFNIKSRTRITDALKELVADGILEKVKTKYYLNKEYHFMGELMETTVFSKIYHVSNRTLLQKISQEAAGLLYKLVPLVNFVNGSVCNNPKETDNEKVEVLIKEDLAALLEIHPDTLGTRIEELIKNGAILPIQVKNSVYYKVHPDFVAKIDYFAARAIVMMIEEHKSVQLQLQNRRKTKKKNKEINEKKEGE